MKHIERLVIGSLQDFDRFREDIEKQEGVILARVPGSSRGGFRRGGSREDSNRGGEFGCAKLLETVAGALEDFRPRSAVFLAPYQGMATDAARLMENGVDVRIAGPMPVLSWDASPPITAIHRSDTGFTAMLEASRHADFGDPVYLRMISSPEGGKWHKWWCVFQSCRKAEALLDSPMNRVYIAVAGKAPKMHVAITLKTDRNSTGHLLVAPDGSRLQDDLFFLGTGGTLSDDSLLNQPGIYGKSDYRMLSRPTGAHLAGLWSEDAAITLTGEEQRFYRNLLRAIGKSAQSGRGMCLEYPAA